MLKSINALKLVVLALAVTVGVIGISATTGAIERTPTEENRNVTTNTDRTAPEQRKATVARLEATKLKACQNRETEIKNTLARITDRGTKRVDTLDKIAIRVQEFYVAKGKVLNNYNSLVTIVDTNRTIVQDAIDNLPSVSTSFECTGENPRAMITDFKDKNLSLNAALKDYKTSIKNLIVGIKSVQGTTTSESNNTTREQR